MYNNKRCGDKEDDLYMIKTIIQKYDIGGDGNISEKDMNIIERVIELESRKAKEADRDKRETAQRKMTWFALFGMLLYPLGIVGTESLGLQNASDLLSDIAPTYFVAIAGLVAAFFGTQVWASKNDN